MKGFLLSVLAVALTATAARGSRTEVIDHPDYEARGSAVMTVTSIERSDTATRMNVHIEYRPHFWVRIDSTYCLVDTLTDTRYCPVGGEGFVFNEEYWMPEEGMADFTIVFPPIPAEVKSVKYDAESWSIYGLRLDGGNASRPATVNPDEWSARHEKPYPGMPTNFFQNGESRLSGHINGYDPRVGMSNFLIYAYNNLTGESNPLSVDVDAEGNFEKTIKMNMPGCVSANFGSYGWINFYLEPSRDLDILLDWEEMLRYQNDRVMERSTAKPPIARYGGELGDINREIDDAPTCQTGWVGDIYKTMTPTEASAQIDEWLRDFNADIDGYIAGASLNPLTKKLLDRQRKMLKAKMLLDYDMMRRDVWREDSLAASLKEPMTPEFFLPLKELLSDSDPLALGGIDQSILNRLAFSGIFEANNLPYLYTVYVSDLGLGYLKEQGATLTPAEEVSLQFITENLGRTVDLTLDEMFKYFTVNISDIAERNGMTDKLTAYLENFTPPAPERPCDEIKYAGKQSQFMKEFAGTEDVPLLWQAALASMICSWSGIKPDNYSREEIAQFLEDLNQSKAITEPVILSAVNDYFKKIFSTDSYELPDDERGRVMKALIAPHKGKYVLVDFWSTGCGPCRYNIEHSAEMRKANLDHPDFKMIFVTSEGESPSEAYEKYVAANLAGETTHRISATDFNRLRDLFGFNGIPHYVLLDRDGKVLNDNFTHSQLRETLKGYGVELK